MTHKPFQPDDIMAFPLIKDGVPQREQLNSFGLNFWQASRKLSIDVAKQLAPNKKYAEFGVYRGESARWLIDGAEELYLFDSFKGLPEKWSEKFKEGHFAVGDEELENMIKDLHLQSKNADVNLEVVVGWFKDTVANYHAEEFGLVHLDADLYSSTKEVLDRIKIFPGQIIIFDELYNIDIAKEEEYKAFKEWVEEYEIKYEPIGRTPYAQAIIRVLEC